MPRQENGANAPLVKLLGNRRARFTFLVEFVLMSTLCEVRELISGYCPTLNAEIAELGSILQRIDAARSDWKTTLADAYEVAHRIKGSTGMIGFSQVSIEARSLELKLRELASAQLLASEACAELNALFISLKSMAASLRPEDSDLFNTDFTDFNKPEA